MGKSIFDGIDRQGRTGRHFTACFVQIIAGARNFKPALLSMSILVKVIPTTTDLFPSPGHITVRLVHIIAVAVAVIQPSGQHFSLVEIVVFIFD